MLQPELIDSFRQLTDELQNFEDIARYILPLSGEIPRVQGIDVYGKTIPLEGVVGGDHIIYVDFKQRYDLDARIEKATREGKLDVAENLNLCRHRSGIVLIDVSGHRITDALLAAMLHQSFLLGALYELELFGQITKLLFEKLNTRFYHSLGGNKFITMIYGEILEDGTFKFLSAAHPPPVVFSNEYNHFMEIKREFFTSFPPIGTLPSAAMIDRGTTESILGFKPEYVLNQWELLGSGDILLLYTDGLLDHKRGDEHYFPDFLEQKLQQIKHLSSRDIFEAVHSDLMAFGEASDDITLVVIKRT